MISTPESNVKFTDEQTRQLDAFRSQLNNIQTEITIAEKNLQMVKEEGVKAFKDKTYLESLLPPLKQELSSLNIHKEELKTETQKIIATLADHDKVMKVQENAQISKTEELSKREQLLIKNEQIHLKNIETLAIQQTKSELLSQQLENAKDTFTKACESVVWK